MPGRITPLGALGRGLAAGAAGAAVQSLFFKATSALAPPQPEGAFPPPEEAQRDEQATETVARRLVEGMMVRGPLDPDRKRRLASAVHYGFGAAWGGLYGLARESWPGLARPAGAAGFGLLVWNMGDNVILPAFRLAAGPGRYPPRNHAYAIAAHLVYGAAVAAAYEALRPRTVALAAAALWALSARRRAARLPARVRPAARVAIDGIARVRAAAPLDRARAALKELRA